MCEPYQADCAWDYLFGDEKNFQVRKFESREVAYRSYRITILGLQSAPEISVRLIRLPLEQVRAVKNLAEYRHVVEFRR
jgi:hypothetical protein